MAHPSAFPGGNPSRYDGRVADGMTLRDWFAGQALTGIMASETFEDSYTYILISHRAYAFADAMLASRGGEG